VSSDYDLTTAPTLRVYTSIPFKSKISLRKYTGWQHTEFGRTAGGLAGFGQEKRKYVKHTVDFPPLEGSYRHQVPRVMEEYGYSRKHSRKSYDHWERDYVLDFSSVSPSKEEKQRAKEYCDKSITRKLTEVYDEWKEVYPVPVREET